MSEPIEFTGVGNLFVCTRCGVHGDGDPARDFLDFTIFYNGRVPVAILCTKCELELQEQGMMDEENGNLTLYLD